MSIPIGGQAVLTLTVKDQTGTLQDPQTVTAEWVDPNGGSGNGTAVRDSLGTYHYNLVLSIAGTWYARFKGTGSFQGASPDIKIICDASRLP